MVFSWIAQALSSPLFGKSLTMFAPIRRADGMVVNIHRSRPTPFPARPAVPRSAISPIIAEERALCPRKARARDVHEVEITGSDEIAETPCGFGS
jgi:hypothetical protein